MAMTRTGTVGAGITIIAKDLVGGSTFNADVKPSQAAILKAATLLKYDATSKQLDRWVGGTDDVSLVCGVLADDCDATSATDVQVALAYRKGTFNRQEIESANNYAIKPGDVTDLGLRDKEIYLDLSYESYEGLNPVPSGSVTTPPYH
jgi:hypothetical protein